MNQLIRRVPGLATMFMVLAIGASVSRASPLSCNNGVNLTCTYWYDIFSGQFYQTDPLATQATLPAAPVSTQPLTVAGWNTQSTTPNADNVLTSVSLTLEWAATGSISVTNFALNPGGGANPAGESFTNAFAFVPLTVSGPGGSTLTVTATSADTNGTAAWATMVPVFSTVSDTGHYNSQLAFLNHFGDPNAAADALADTHDYCLSEGFYAPIDSDPTSGGGQGGSSFNSGAKSCGGVQTGTTSSATVTAASSGKLTGATTSSGLALSAFEGGAPLTVNFGVSSGTAHATGDQTDLGFSGTGSAGGILRITYNAEQILTPEPFTLVLVGGSLIGLGVVARRRNTRRP
ncbi:exported hypothetical protein [Candidatus Sulfopaludibacter sp. SbA3]|nr:exported hypothetical protein [Candidatus Sulfopaludibacter sp. SbA3]